MFWWLLGGAVAAIALFVVISGPVDKKAIKNTMEEEGIVDAIITGINNSTNTITLSSGHEIKGDSIGNDIKKGQRIRI